MSEIPRASMFQRFVSQRKTFTDFIETDSYEEELKRIWRPDPVRRFQRMMIGFFAVTPVLCYFFGGIFCYSVVIIMMLVALGEFKAIRRDQRNIKPENEQSLRARKYFTYALYLVLPLLVFNLVALMAVFARADTTLFESIGLVLSAGYAGGALAINVGHELVHRRDKFESNVGGLLLSIVCYATFKVEHVRGHHVYVSTPEDASSAPMGMSLYQFLPRAWVMNPINGFKLEAKRLKGQDKHWLHWENELLWWTALSASFALLSYAVFGLAGLAFFFLQAFVSITLLEIINYVEHYGLERKKMDTGRYERVTQHHSWNAS